MVNIGLDWLLSVWINYYQSRSVNISLDGLNVKKVLVNIGKHWLISVKILVEACDINRHLDRIMLINYRLILTNYRLRMTKTRYVEYEI